METNKIYQGNSVEKLKEIEANKVDLIYFDPPFFTQRKHTLTNKDKSKTYEFDDKYNSIEEYSVTFPKLSSFTKKNLMLPSGTTILRVIF